MKTLLTLLILLFTGIQANAQPTDRPRVKTYGVKINVTDLDQAIDFYCNKIGFEIERRVDEERRVFLKNMYGKLMLNEVRLPSPLDSWEARGTITFQVNHLDSTINKLRAKGVKITDDLVRKEAVGNALYMYDPFGNPISLMHQTIATVPHFDEPKIYNYGFFVADMDAMRKFYCETFSFVVRSDKYLPLDLPLGHKDHTFAFMLHYRDGVKPVRSNYTDNERIVILFQTDNLDEAMASMKERGIRFQQSKPVESKTGRYISFYDPFGYLSELVETGE